MSIENQVTLITPWVLVTIKTEWSDDLTQIDSFISSPHATAKGRLRSYLPAAVIAGRHATQKGETRGPVIPFAILSVRHDSPYIAFYLIPSPF